MKEGGGTRIVAPLSARYFLYLQLLSPKFFLNFHLNSTGSYSCSFQPGFHQSSPRIPQIYNLELGSSKLVSLINAQGFFESLECFI